MREGTTKLYIGVKRLDELNVLLIDDLCPLSITVSLTMKCQKQLTSSFTGIFSYGEGSLFNTCYRCVPTNNTVVMMYFQIN